MVHLRRKVRYDYLAMQHESPAIELLELEQFVENMEADLRELLALTKIAAECMEDIPHDRRDRERKNGGTWRDSGGGGGLYEPGSVLRHLSDTIKAPGAMAWINIAGMSQRTLRVMRRLRSDSDLMVEAAEKALETLLILREQLAELKRNAESDKPGSGENGAN